MNTPTLLFFFLIKPDMFESFSYTGNLNFDQRLAFANVLPNYVLNNVKPLAYPERID